MPGVAGNRTSDPLITSLTPNQLSYFDDDDDDDNNNNNIDNDNYNNDNNYDNDDGNNDSNNNNNDDGNDDDNNWSLQRSFYNAESVTLYFRRCLWT